MGGGEPPPEQLPLDPTDSLLTGQVLPGFAAAGIGGGASQNTPAASVRRRTWLSRFLPEHMYEYYARQSALAAASLPSGHHRLLEVPGEFTSVLPLDKAMMDDGSHAAVTGSYGYVTSLFKGLSIEDGLAYTLRRVENVRVPPHVCEHAVQAWRKAAHPSVVTLRRAFSAGSALFFQHDYYPGAHTLRELYLEHRGPLLPERLLWSFICQLTAGLRAVHDAGLSFRGVHAAHVLVTGHNRVRLGGAGVVDVLESDSAKPLAECQQADMLSFGQMLLALATRSAGAAGNVPAALDAVLTHYSPALHALIVLLLSKPVPVQEICRLLAPQMLAELDSAYDHADALDSLLAREADNGRVLRLLVKLGFVNERPSHEGDPSWAETGDRYLLKLFRDYVFHQTSDEGAPVLDVAHVLEALNQLDMGSPTRVLLCSRDGGSILVASYAQLRKALNAAFDDLRGGAPAAPSASSSDAAAAAAAGKPHIFRGGRGGRSAGRPLGRGGLMMHGSAGIAHRGLAAAGPAAGVGGLGGHGAGGGIASLHAHLQQLSQLQGVQAGGAVGGDHTTTAAAAAAALGLGQGGAGDLSSLPPELAASLPADLQGLLQGLGFGGNPGQPGGAGEGGDGSGVGYEGAGDGSASPLPSEEGGMTSQQQPQQYDNSMTPLSGMEDDGSGGVAGGGDGAATVATEGGAVAEDQYYGGYYASASAGAGGAEGGGEGGGGDVSGGGISGHYQEYHPQTSDLDQQQQQQHTQYGYYDPHQGPDLSLQQQQQQQGYREFVPSTSAYAQPYEPSAAGDGGTYYDPNAMQQQQQQQQQQHYGYDASGRPLAQHVSAAEFVPSYRGEGEDDGGQQQQQYYDPNAPQGQGQGSQAAGNLNVSAAEFRPAWAS